MIKTATVFVLGAGASSVFNFPMGGVLRNQTIDYLAPNHQQRGIFLKNTTFTEGDLDHFREQLRFSAQPSVDLFLENRPEFLAIDKAAMACLLIMAEWPDILWGASPENWMTYLFDRMRALKF